MVILRLTTCFQCTKCDNNKEVFKDYKLPCTLVKHVGISYLESVSDHDIQEYVSNLYEGRRNHPKRCPNGHDDVKWELVSFKTAMNDITKQFAVSCMGDDGVFHKTQVETQTKPVVKPTNRFSDIDVV